MVSEREDGNVYIDTHMRLELHPNGSFAYHFRDPETDQAQREPVRGRWGATPGNEWMLIPSNGRDGLVPGDFDPGAFPEVKWRGLPSKKSHPPGLGPTLEVGSEYWRVPSPDIKTGRITRSFVIATDIRRTRMFEAASKSGE